MLAYRIHGADICAVPQQQVGGGDLVFQDQPGGGVGNERRSAAADEHQYQIVFPSATDGFNNHLRALHAISVWQGMAGGNDGEAVSIAGVCVIGDCHTGAVEQVCR